MHDAWTTESEGGGEDARARCASVRREAPLPVGGGHVVGTPPIAALVGQGGCLRELEEVEPEPLVGELPPALVARVGERDKGCAQPLVHLLDGHAPPRASALVARIVGPHARRHHGMSAHGVVERERGWRRVRLAAARHASRASALLAGRGCCCHRALPCAFAFRLAGARVGGLGVGDVLGWRPIGGRLGGCVEAAARGVEAAGRIQQVSAREGVRPHRRHVRRARAVHQVRVVVVAQEAI